MNSITETLWNVLIGFLNGFVIGLFFFGCFLLVLKWRAYWKWRWHK